jgi:hypothetical protein
MAADIAWLDSDGVTPVATVNYGVIGPGESYSGKHGGYRQFVAKNVGTEPLSAVQVAIQQVGTYDAHERVTIATGATPGAFTGRNTPLSLGAMAAGASANVWVEITEPLTAVLAQGKLFNLVLTGAV